MKLEADLESSIQMHENEVTMRLKFESKLNNLSAIYREIESRFLVLCKDYSATLNRIQMLYDKNEVLVKESSERLNLNTTLEFKFNELNEK